MLKRLLIGLAVACLAGAPVTASAAVKLSILDGRVWLAADRATIAEILAEWGRVGHTQILNAERVGDTPLTLDLRGVPELDALDVIMRSAGGFVTVSRTIGPGDGTTSLSRFSRVVVVPSAGLAKDRDMRAARPAPPPYTPPVDASVVGVSNGQRVIGPDGQPVPDDQEDAPPPPLRALPVLPPGTSLPPGFSEPPDAGSPRRTIPPGVITPPVQPPRRPGVDPISR